MTHSAPAQGFAKPASAAESLLRSMFSAAIAAAQPDICLPPHLPEYPRNGRLIVLGAGKASAAMARAAEAHYGRPLEGLVITRYGHAVPCDGIEIVEAAHPVPDAQSLVAGQAALEFVTACGPEAHLLLLVSGGASALAEALPADWDLARLTEETQMLLASGADIHAMNARRKEISQIKGGKLVARFGGARVTTLAISDVEGDALDVIGSGIGAGPASDGVAFEARIIASNAIAREAIAAATDLPLTVNDETLYDNVTTLAPRIADHIRAMPKGLLLLGGEPTVLLPDNPGKGGRNMALAALLARELADVDGVEILVAGTDGTDGPTDAAGAIVDGSTWKSTGAAALERADIYPWLKDQGALFVSGPTGTNVMDILLARKS